MDAPIHKHHHHYHRKLLPEEENPNINGNSDYSQSRRSQSQYESEEDEHGLHSEPYTPSYIEEESESDKSTKNKFSSPVPQSLNLGSNSPKISMPLTEINQSYVNIAPLPVFRGTHDECPFTHLSRFSKVCRANNASSIDAMKRIFPVTLEDEAALWYDLNIEPYDLLTWEEIKSTFLEAYRTDEIDGLLGTKLMMIKQGDDERVRSYFLRLQWILKRWPEHGISDNLMKGIFIEGLKDDFKNWIIPQKPDSLSEALRLAFSWEQVGNIRRKKELNCRFCDGRQAERDCEIGEKMRELLAKSDGEKHLRIEGGGGEDVTGERQEMEDAKEEGSVKKRSQCQCWKHQCWKKKFERNNSAPGNKYSNNAD